MYNKEKFLKQEAKLHAKSLKHCRKYIKHNSLFAEGDIVTYFDLSTGQQFIGKISEVYVTYSKDNVYLHYNWYRYNKETNTYSDIAEPIPFNVSLHKYKQT